MMSVLSVNPIYQPDGTWLVTVGIGDIVYSGAASTLEAAMTALRVNMGDIPEATLPFVIA